MDLLRSALAGALFLTAVTPAMAKVELPEQAQCYFDAVAAKDAEAVGACFADDGWILDVDREIRADACPRAAVSTSSRGHAGIDQLRWAAAEALRVASATDRAQTPRHRPSRRSSSRDGFSQPEKKRSRASRRRR